MTRPRMSRRAARPNSAWASSPSGSTSPQEALRHYCNVLYDPDTRHADPAWVKDAGVKAAALYEEQKDWPDAEEVYRRVQEVVPSLRLEMQKNIDKMQKNMDRTQAAAPPN